MAKDFSPHKIKFFGSPWSAPAWLKTNNKLIEGGFIKGKPGEVRFKLTLVFILK